jgi:pectinesterase
MKTRLLATVSILIFLSPFVFCREKVLLVKISNPSQFSRRSEMISLRWSEIRKELPSFESSNVVVIDKKTNAELMSQSNEDDLLFRSDFSAKETKSFAIKQGSREGSKGESLVDGMFIEPRQDYAWENDRIAFRMYGPALAAEVSNGIDVWTKRVRYSIVQKWYKGEEDTGKAKISYHIDHGEGADFFSVGKTLGAGGSGIWINNRVYQPGVFSSQKTICNGPLRITFELTYNTWLVEGKQLTETKRISLDAGQNLNRIEVTFTSPIPGDTILVACGLVKRKNTVLSRGDKNPWIGLWGQTNEDSVNGALGTGVVLLKSTFVGVYEEKDQHLIIGRVKAGETFAYYAGAGWTRSGDFVSSNEWNTYLENCAQKLQQPLRIRLINQK